MHDVEIQRQYYAETAKRYDETRAENDEQAMALAGAFLDSAIVHLNAKSVLDIGSGTGRTLRKLKQRHPGIPCVGVEPVAALREVGYEAGLTSDELVAGDAKVEYADGEFDVVCEFAVLHHVPNPEKVVAEMLRVARKAIFICDSNNFGHGTLLSRALKQTLNALRVWPIADYLKTRGKGYTISEGDGLAYSYSIFNNLAQINRACTAVHFLNTVHSGADLYRTAPSVAILALKRLV
jgi:ubiquinone/menaquinone biosynthesis C-methylase UbiE